MRNNIVLFLVTTICLVLGGCRSEQNGAAVQAPVVPIKATVPQVKELTVYVEALGTLKPSVMVEVRPQISGQLQEILVKEGEWVDKGMPLFKVDAKPYSIKVQEAEAQLAIHHANWHGAQAKLARIKPLAQKDLVSQAEKEGIETQVEAAQGEIALAEARLKQAKWDCEHCTISSTMAGRIGKLDIHPGTLIAVGQAEPLATISQLDPLQVEFALTEKDFPKLPEESSQIELKPLCAPSQCKMGKLTFFDNHFDAAKGLIMVRGTVPNPDMVLRPGQGVQVRIPIAVTEDAILIPQKAIRYNQNGPYIYVVQPDQTVVVRQLKLGDEHGTDQVVLEGIAPAEQLVIEGHLRLSAGAKVEVKP